MCTELINLCEGEEFKIVQSVERGAGRVGYRLDTFWIQLKFVLYASYTFGIRVGYLLESF